MTHPAAAPGWGPLIRAELYPLRQRPLVWITVAFLLGIVWADLVTPPPFPVALICGLALLLTGFAVWRVPGAVARLLLVCCFLLGGMLHAWRLAPGAAAQVPPEGLELAQMEGVVTAAREWHEVGGQTIVLNWKGPHGQTLDRVDCWLDAGPRVQVGDRVLLEEVTLYHPRPSTVPGEPDAVRDMARVGIHLGASAARVVRIESRQFWRGPLEDGLAQARGRFLQVLTDAMPGATADTYAALLASMVYGMGAAPVPPDITDLFRRSGTIHLLVASGAQVSIIALSLMFLVRGTRRVLPVWGMVVVTLGLLAFALLAGMDVSIRRALGMSVILLGTYVWGRRYDLPSALALTALVLCAFDSGVLFAAGAQLTYACVIGVYLAWPPHRPGQSRLQMVLAAAAWGSLGAWLMATPVLIVQFHGVVLLGTLANLVAVPLAAVLLYLGLLAIGLGLVWLPLAIPLCAAARALLDVMLWSNTFFASLPLATLDQVYLQWPWLLLWYGVAACLFAFLRSAPLRRRLLATDPRWAMAGAVAVLGLVLLWVVVVQPPANRLRVHVLNVGAAQCVLVEAPGGKVLIDAGADAIPGQAEDILHRRVLPFLALHHVRALDALVISHAHEDHCNLAAPIMQAIPTRRLLLGPGAGAEGGWLQMLQTARERQVEMAPFAAGGALRLGPHTWLQVLGPSRGATFREDPVNNGSLVLRLAHEQTVVLLPADIAAEGERRLLREYLRPGALHADVLLAPHHGSGGSCTLPFLQAVAPRAVIISCAGGRRGPPVRTLRRFEELSLQVWRTDVNGVITVTSDGRAVSVRGTARAGR